jgi:hypothetical protein
VSADNRDNTDQGKTEGLHRWLQAQEREDQDEGTGPVREQRERGNCVGYFHGHPTGGGVDDHHTQDPPAPQHLAEGTEAGEGDAHPSPTR